MTQTTVKENDGRHPSVINSQTDACNPRHTSTPRFDNSVEEDVTNENVTVSEHTEKKLELISVEKLFTHPKNTSVYGENENLGELVNAIASSKWIEPLLVSPVDGDRYCIISGNSRFKAAKKLGVQQLLAEVKIFESEVEELETFLSANVQREKTVEQKVREGWLWEKVEKEKAFQRMNSGQANDPTQNFAEGRGEVRNIVAEKVGLGSGFTYDKASKAVKKLDELKDAEPGTPESDYHQQLKELLSKPKGVDAAYKLVSTTQKSKKLPEKWLPKVGERISIIAGPHKGNEGTVTVLLSMCSLVHIDGTHESKRDQIQFRDMKPIESVFNSVKEEVTAKQKELGLGTKEQVLPDIPRNTGIPKDVKQQSSVVNLLAKGDALITEIAIALIGLSAKELFQAIDIAQKEFSSAQSEAVWRAMQSHFLHKAS